MKNQIEIKGISIINLKKALNNWINEYSDNLNSKLKFKIFKEGRNHQIVVIENEIKSEHFFYLVNYLEFYENEDYEVMGNLKVTNLDQELDNKKLFVYISKSDTEYDNVYTVTNEDENYKIDFEGKITKISSEVTYSEIIEKTGSTSHIVKVDSSEKKESKKEIFIPKIKKRFNIIFIIFLSMNIIYFITPFFTRDINTISNYTIFICIITFIWFMCEETMLQFSNFYLKFLLISICFVGFGELFKEVHNYTLTELPSFFSFLPFSFLVIQLPTRLLYLKMFKREPKIDRSGKFVDLIYSLFVGFLPIFISGMIYEYLKS